MSLWHTGKRHSPADRASLRRCPGRRNADRWRDTSISRAAGAEVSTYRAHALAQRRGGRADITLPVCTRKRKVCCVIALKIGQRSEPCRSMIFAAKPRAPSRFWSLTVMLLAYFGRFQTMTPVPSFWFSKKAARIGWAKLGSSSLTARNGVSPSLDS